jgi:hypothetical protein
MYIIKIIETATNNVEEILGKGRNMSLSEAERVEIGININLNDKKYHTIIEEVK